MRCTCPLFAMLTGAALLLSQTSPVPIGTVAGHALLRANANGGVVEAYGYFPFADGLGANLFAGAPGERTSVLTFRTNQFRTSLLPNGLVGLVRPSPLQVEGVTYNVYFDPAPARDFAQPASFSTGTLVGVYRGNTASIVTIEGRTLHYTASLDLVSSSDFQLRDQTWNLARIAPAIHVNVTGLAPALSQLASGEPLSVAMGGSFTSIAARSGR